MKYQKNIVRVLTMLTVLIVLSLFIISTSYGQPNDGLIDDEEEHIRIVDFDVASNTIPVGVRFESSVIVANYGTEQETIDLIIESEHIDTGEIEQHGEFTVELEPGEHKEYSTFIELETDDEEFRIYPTNGDDIDGERATKEIYVTKDGSSSEVQTLVDRKKDTVLSRNPTSFHDGVLELDDRLGYSQIIPPSNLENKSGQILDFRNLIDDRTTTSAAIEPSSDNNLKSGLSYQRIPGKTHYHYTVLYDPIQGNEIELNIVNSAGEEIDEETSYYLGNEEKQDIQLRNIQLSSEENKYIQDQNEIFVLLEGEIDERKEIFIMQMNAGDNIHDFSDSDGDNIDVNTRIENEDNPLDVRADVVNNSQSSIIRRFNLIEDSPLHSNDLVSVTGQKIVNPDEEIELSFEISAALEGEYKFTIDGDSASTMVDDPIDNSSSIGIFNRREIRIQSNPASITNVFLNRWGI